MDINEIRTHAYALFRMLGEAKMMEYLKRQVENKTITEDQVEEMNKNLAKK